MIGFGVFGALVTFGTASVVLAAVLFWFGGLILPGVHVAGFGIALRAAVAMTFWRIILFVPAVILIAMSTVPSVAAETAGRNATLGLVLLVFVDVYALHRAERAVLEFRIDGLLSRLTLLFLMPLCIGVGIRIALS